MIYLLTLEVGSLTFFIATEGVTLSSDNGDLRFLGGLSAQTWTEEWGLNADSDVEDVPIELIPGTLDVGALVLQGYSLAKGRAEYARIRPGQTYERRRVLFRGRVSDPTYDTAADPVAFSLRQIGRAAAILDPPGWRLFNGKVMPTVFGEPRNEAASIRTTIGYAKSVTEVIVADHRCADGTTVTLRDTESVNPESAGVAVSWDGLHSIALKNGLATMEYHVVWHGPAMLRYGSTEPVLTAGQLVERMLSLTGEIDEARTRAAAPLLTTRLAGYYDEQVDPLEWLRANVLPLIPAAIVRGPDGYYPIVWRAYLPDHQAAFDFQVDRGDIERISGVAWEGCDEIVNHVELSFCFDQVTGDYTERVTFTGDKDYAHSADDVDTFLSTEAQASFLDFGAAQRVLDSDVVYLFGAAHEVCAYLIRRHGQPSRVTAYALRDRLTDIERGEAVRITDTEAGIDGMCMVEVVSDEGDGIVRIQVRTAY